MPGFSSSGKWVNHADAACVGHVAQHGSYDTTKLAMPKPSGLG